ncbi:CAAX prenyl protease-related protein [Candidatus Desantisbacteria bacterium]|nr:CAAX prenyl protease-related protein [Candidatus Desantisbacteria bacterium]
MIPYILPFILYITLTQIPFYFPEFYPWLYTACVILVGAATIYSFHLKKLLKIHNAILPGIIFGITGIIVWIFLSQLHLEAKLFTYLPKWIQPEKRPAFNPFQSIPYPFLRWTFIIVRTTGVAVLVPIAEELFWRGFLMRWIITPDWEKQEIGIFNIKAFLWTTLLFILAHPEWLAAAAYFCLISILFYWKKDLWNCIVAHSISNLILVFYVIHTKTWELW